MRADLRLSTLLLLFAAATALAAPALGSLAGFDLLAAGSPRLAALLGDHGVQLATGWAAAATVVFLFLHGVRMRTSLTFGIPYPLWIAIHHIVGVGFLALVLVHTGGHWGWHLNGWLTAAALAAAFAGIGGKLSEFLFMTQLIVKRLEFIPDRRRTPVAERRGRRRPVPDRRTLPGDAPAPALYRFRTAWTALHLVVSAVLVVTLAAHVASVWYF